MLHISDFNPDYSWTLNISIFWTSELWQHRLFLDQQNNAEKNAWLRKLKDSEGDYFQ